MENSMESPQKLKIGVKNWEMAGMGKSMFHSWAPAGANSSINLAVFPVPLGVSPKQNIEIESLCCETSGVQSLAPQNSQNTNSILI